MLLHFRTGLLIVAACATTCAHGGITEESAIAEKAAEKAAQKEVPPQILKLAKGKLLLPVPGDWKPVDPRSRIIQHEYSVEPAKGDDTGGRMTIMAAGGGVEANIQRWVGQFKNSDGGPIGDEAKKIQKKNIGNVPVHVVDLAGDFQDSPRGPFGPKVNRPNYRMLAAIIPLSDVSQVKAGGTWFIKFYGPKATIEAAEKSFAKMVEGVKLAP